MRHLIIFLFLLAPFLSNAQGTVSQGSATQRVHNKGYLQVDSGVTFSVKDTVAWYAFKSDIVRHFANNKLYFKNENGNYIEFGAGGGGAIDTTYLSARIDSLYLNKLDIADSGNIYITPTDLANAISSIPGVDTSTIYYNLDSLYAYKVNIYDSNIVFTTPHYVDSLISNIPGIDTTSLSNRIDEKVNTADSNIVYVTPHFVDSVVSNIPAIDTTSLSNRIDEKVNLSDSNIIYVTPFELQEAIASIPGFDTTNIYIRLNATLDSFAAHNTRINAKISYSDSSGMLSPYRTRILALYDTASAHLSAINARIKYSDSAAMLSAYRTALLALYDTAGVHRSTLNGKVNYTDTNAMLTAYRTRLLAMYDSLAAHRTAFNAAFSAGSFDTTTRVLTLTRIGGGTVTVTIPGGGGGGTNTNIGNSDLVINTGAPDGERYLYLNENEFRVHGPGDIVLGNDSTSTSSRNAKIEIRDVVNYTEGGLVWDQRIANDIDNGIRIGVGEFDDGFTFVNDRHLYLQSFGFELGQESYDFVNNTNVGASISSESNNISFSGNDEDGGSGTINLNPVPAEGSVNWYPQPNKDGYVAFLGDTANIFATKSDLLQLDSTGALPASLSLGTITTTSIPININTGTGVTVPQATTSTAGLMSASDKAKLDTLTGGGGTGSGTVNPGAANRIAYYPASGTMVDDLAAITPNRALISNGSGLPTHSTVTATELGYSSGVTSNIQTQLNGKANTSHTHSISQVTGLQDSLNAKAPAVKGIPNGGTVGQALVKNSSANNDVSWATISGGGGTSNLGLGSITTTDVPITNSNGTGVTIPSATASTAGVMTSSLYSKLMGIATGAEVNVNADWNAVSGDAQILNKPSTFPPSTHSHPISQVTSLQDSLNVKAPIARAVPAGGTIGQALVKSSNSNYDLQWATVSSGGSPANLSLGTATDSTRAISNDNGTGVTVPAATNTTAGLLRGSEKIIINGIDTMRTAIYNALSGKLNISDTGGMLTNYWDKNDFTSTNISNWNTAYNDKINSLSVTGTTTKTITLTQQDGGTVTGSFTDLQGGADSSIFFTNFRADSMRSNIYSAISGKQNALGFTPENVSNKATNLTSPDNTKYPTTQAVVNAISGLISTEVDPNSIHKYPTSAQAATGWIDSSFRAKTFHMGPGTSGTTDLSIGETAPNSGSVNIWASLKDQYWDSLLLQNGGGTLVLGPASGDGTTVVPVVAGGGDRYVRTNDNGVLSASSTVPWSDVSSAPPFLTSEVDGSVTNELQTISRSGQTITLSNSGGSVLDSCKTYTGTAPIGISGTYPSYSVGLNDDGVTNAKLANMAANSIKANATTGSDNPTDLQIGTNEFVGRASGNLKGLKMGPEFYVQNDTVRVQQTTYGVPTLSSLDPTHISVVFKGGDDQMGQIDITPLINGSCARIELEFSTPFGDFVYPQLTLGQPNGQCDIATAHIDTDNTDLTKLTIVLDNYATGQQYSIFYHTNGR